MWGEKSGFCPLPCLLTQGVHVSLGETCLGWRGSRATVTGACVPPSLARCGLPRAHLSPPHYGPGLSRRVCPLIPG